MTTDTAALFMRSSLWHRKSGPGDAGHQAAHVRVVIVPWLEPDDHSEQRDQCSERLPGRPPLARIGGRGHGGNGDAGKRAEQAADAARRSGLHGDFVAEQLADDISGHAGRRRTERPGATGRSDAASGGPRKSSALMLPTRCLRSKCRNDGRQQPPPLAIA